MSVANNSEVCITTKMKQMLRHINCRYEALRRDVIVAFCCLVSVAITTAAEEIPSNQSTYYDDVTVHSITHRCFH